MATLVIWDSWTIGDYLSNRQPLPRHHSLVENTSQIFQLDLGVGPVAKKVVLKSVLFQHNLKFQICTDSENTNPFFH